MEHDTNEKWVAGQSAWRARRGAAIAVPFFLAACAGGPPGDTTELDQPLFGSNRETRFAMTTPTGQLKLRDIAAVAKVIRKYKTLEAAEKALVEVAVRKHIDAL